MARHHLLTTAFLTLLGMTGAVYSPPATAQPVGQRFSCGQYLLTFVVKSLDQRSGQGIRCVKPGQVSFANQRTPQLSWYGEGNWQGSTYRHVGHAFGRGGSLVGSASDINGNGEDIHNNFPGNLKVTILSGSLASPIAIQVTGAWNERWVRVGSVAYQPLPLPKTCGSYFDEYGVSDLSGSRSGEGLRCVLKVGAPNTTWFGTGQWEGSTYSHLGSRGFKGFGASDFCHSSFGSICNNFNYGTILLKPASPAGIDVTGSWSEKWR